MADVATAVKWRSGWGLLLTLTSIFTLSPEIGASDFTLIGDLPGGARRSVARAISADGLIVAGTGQTELGSQGWVWSADAGFTSLPFISSNLRAAVFGMSDDGSIVVGEARNLFNMDQAVVWTRQPDESYQATPLSVPSGSKFEFGSGFPINMVAYDVSGDGAVVVGQGETKENTGGRVFEAFYWTTDHGVEPMGNLSQQSFLTAPREFDGLPVLITKPAYSSARGINRSGSQIVGLSRSGFFPAPSDRLVSEAFLYDFSASRMQSIRSSQQPVFKSNAEAISNDGSTITGQLHDPVLGQQAFRYTKSTGMEPIGDLATGSEVATGFAVNANGAVIVGRGTVEQDFSLTNSVHRAFVWTRSLGLRCLARTAGLTSDDLGPYGFIEEALAVSDDGLTIAGTYGDASMDRQTPDRMAFIINFTPSELGLEESPEPAVIAEELNITFTTTSISFPFRSDLSFTYTLQSSPDLSTPFRDRIRFTPDGSGSFRRIELAPKSQGSAILAKGKIRETPVEYPDGFWRLRISYP